MKERRREGVGWRWMCACSVVHRYDEMAEKVSEIPDDIQALVELQNYYQKVSADLTVSPL